jgi:hypothetical protein
MNEYSKFQWHWKDISSQFRHWLLSCLRGTQKYREISKIDTDLTVSPLSFNPPPTRLLFDPGEETFPMETSTFSVHTDRTLPPGRPRKSSSHFPPHQHTFYKVYWRFQCILISQFIESMKKSRTMIFLSMICKPVKKMNKFEWRR